MGKHRDKLAEMLDEGVLDAKQLASDLLGYISEDDCEDFADKNGIELFPEDEETETYSAGWNMPGYMPDNPPEEFDDADDARAYIAEAMRDEAEQDDERVDDPDHAYAELLRNAADECEAGTGEYGAIIGRFHYFVTKI